jgi:hypothetical protein
MHTSAPAASASARRVLGGDTSSRPPSGVCRTLHSCRASQVWFAMSSSGCGTVSTSTGGSESTHRQCEIVAVRLEAERQVQAAPEGATSVRHIERAGAAHELTESGSARVEAA